MSSVGEQIDMDIFDASITKPIKITNLLKKLFTLLLSEANGANEQSEANGKNGKNRKNEQDNQKKSHSAILKKSVST